MTMVPGQALDTTVLEVWTPITLDPGGLPTQLPSTRSPGTTVTILQLRLLMSRYVLDEGEYLCSTIPDDALTRRKLVSVSVPPFCAPSSGAFVPKEMLFIAA